MYTLDQYARAAMRSLSDECAMDPDKALLNAALGLAGESGEVADHVKKNLFHGHSLDFVKVKKELGDILWYIAEACYALGFDLDDVASTNIDKLLKRYPDGFSVERSINRVEE